MAAVRNITAAIAAIAVAMSGAASASAAPIGAEALTVEGAAISGTVTLNGAAATNGCVEVWGTGAAPVDRTCDISGGGYLLDGLEPGRYQLFFVGFTDAADSWFGGGFTRDTAEFVDLAEHGLVEVDQDLARGGVIRGGLPADDDPTKHAYKVALFAKDGDLLTFAEVSIPSDGRWVTYRFENIPAGTYNVAVKRDKEDLWDFYLPAQWVAPGEITLPNANWDPYEGDEWVVEGVDFGWNLYDPESEHGAFWGRLNVPSTWKSSIVCAVAVDESGGPRSASCGPRGAIFNLGYLRTGEPYKILFTNGEVRTKAQFKSFTGAKRYYGNTTSAAAAPMYMPKKDTTNYAPTWFFSDVVYKKTPNLEKVQWMGDQGLMTGYSDGTFHPSYALNRRDLVVYLYKMAGSPKITLPPKSPFADVAKGTSATYKAIVWAKQKSIVSGTHFYPTAAVTRSSAALILYKYAGSPKVTLPSKSPYKDVKKSTSVTYKAIIWAKNKKIIGAASGSYFKPSSKVVRSSGAAYLYNYWWYVG